MIVVRRFMYLDVNENEYSDPATRPPPQENAIPLTKQFCLKLLESTIVEGFSMVVICFYTVFVLFQLTNSQMGEFISSKALANVDSYFLVLFLVEICLKSFASNLMYLNDGFNLFDTVIVVVSLVYNATGDPIVWMGALRLVRVVVIIIRKITGNTSKLRHQTKNMKPVESVIKILEQIKEQPNISDQVVKEALWAIDLIESNKLYEMNFDISSDQKNMDMDAKAWLNMTTDVANDTTRWFERDLDDFLKEIHREIEEVDHAKIDEDEEKLRQLLDCNQRTWNQVSKMMDDFDNT